MIYISKPKRVGIYVNTRRLTLAQIKKETGCTAIANGGLFDMTTFKPVCHLKADGVVYAKDQWTYFGLGWNTNDVRLIVDYSSVQNYICCVCIVRGGKAEDVSNITGALGGSRPRTAMGVMPDGRVWLYCDKVGKTPAQLAEIAVRAGCTDALMLDGGGSTQGIFPAGTVTSNRIVQNYICIWDTEESGNKDDERMKVCIDPGHGGIENYNGAPDGSYKEHQFALDLANRIKPILTARGVDVLLTRKTDITVSQSNRATTANDYGADCYVSLHSNAVDGNGGWDDGTTGLCVYTYAEGGKRDKLANLLLKVLKGAGVEIFGAGLYHAKYTVLANTTMPAVLIKYGFHTSRSDTAKLIDDAYRDKLAKATADAVCGYLGVMWPDDPPEKKTLEQRIEALENRVQKLEKS